MGKKGVAVAATGSGGLVGYLAGKLTPGDVRHLIEQLIDVFKQQGPYGLYSLLITFVFIGMLVGFVKLVTKWKQDEISRISAERDRFQQLIIADWKSTHGGKKK